jgi:hypothetical protein
MTNAIKVVLQRQSGFLQLDSTLDTDRILTEYALIYINQDLLKFNIK